MAQDLNPFSEIRKESLDVYNRLHSIEEDLDFVNVVHDSYPDLPLIPNLRCGAWYTDPARATNVPAYFKSTDGHFNNWSFNLRRSNLHLLSVIMENSGIILVDSTRSGKRIPDALSKTVPIWCAVINRALRIRYPDINRDEWDDNLYTPPTTVSSQEHSQISMRIYEWALALTNSSFDLPKLPWPLRPFWITPASTSFPKFSIDSDTRRHLPVICVSASKQVHDGTERRTGGFSYIQGSGDDHELWGMGLFPETFWNEREQLLSASRADLPDLIAALASNGSTPSPKYVKAPEGISKISNRISLSKLSELGLEPSLSLPHTAFILIDEAEVTKPTSPANPSTQADSTSPEQKSEPGASLMLEFKILGGKRSQAYFLHDVLPSSLRFIDDKLSHGLDIVIACPSAKDLGVGVALAAISQYFDDHGEYVKGGQDLRLTKQTIRARLEWIIASCPRANPSRTTLKRVNELLLTEEHLRR
ncbi:initiator tRNA phosphoribosyl transferase [Coprinellus micaceus]|uniref:Initiator tRNA phosphoribosyl transferase n=1 Tax=Coprinellus micaceus TaxID=71717 RepID=A0A4Y7TVF5_COPMI|nr:initiator tRNA phosphoribosyl transferase [Coprinellus micaceus]